MVKTGVSKPRQWFLRGAILILLVAIGALGSSLFVDEYQGSGDATEILAQIPATPVSDALLGLPPIDPGTSAYDVPAHNAPTYNTPAYNRAEFGARWADTDHNGCDTRNDILARDLTQVVFKDDTNQCVVAQGKLSDPYTGKTINFQRGQDTSSMVQIDHVVALADAWYAGAWQWDLSKREEFANDPVNLLAVDGPANQQKSAASADEWLPANRDYHCDFAARQIAVKDKWTLGVTDEERATLAKVVASCGWQELPLD